jgi:TRAP-type C4-dicarboxylate transport system permease small subunit
MSPARFVENVLVRTAGTLGGLALLLLAVVITCDALARAFQVQLVGASEIGGVMLAALIFLCIADTQRMRGHVAIEALVTYYPPRLRRAAELVGLVCCLAFTTLLAWGSILATADSIAKQEFQFGTVQFPLWPVKAVIAVGFLLLCAQLALQVVRDALVLAGRIDHPGEAIVLPQTTV